jgi:hypothetical protein
LYEQAEKLGLCTRAPAQRKLTLTDQGLGLRLSTGTQLEDEPMKKKKEKVATRYQKQKWSNRHLDHSCSICRSSREALLLGQLLKSWTKTRQQQKKIRSRL